MFLSGKASKNHDGQNMYTSCLYQERHEKIITVKTPNTSQKKHFQKRPRHTDTTYMYIRRHSYVNCLIFSSCHTATFAPAGHSKLMSYAPTPSPSWLSISRQFAESPAKTPGDFVADRLSSDMGAATVVVSSSLEYSLWAAGDEDELAGDLERLAGESGSELLSSNFSVMTID